MTITTSTNITCSCVTGWIWQFLLPTSLSMLSNKTVTQPLNCMSCKPRLRCSNGLCWNSYLLNLDFLINCHIMTKEIFLKSLEISPNIMPQCASQSKLVNTTPVWLYNIMSKISKSWMLELRHLLSKRPCLAHTPMCDRPITSRTRDHSNYFYLRMLGNFAYDYFFFKMKLLKKILSFFVSWILSILASNSLDPDQAQHYVWPDLGPNWLQRLSAS